MLTKFQSDPESRIPSFSKFQKDPSITFWVILLTHRQTNRQTDKQSPAKTLPPWRR